MKQKNIKITLHLQILSYGEIGFVASPGKTTAADPKYSLAHPCNLPLNVDTLSR